MIRLTYWEGRQWEPIYIAPEHIRVVQLRRDERCQSRVYFGNDNYRDVKETPEEIVRMVQEYRVAMQQYMVACQNISAEISYWERQLDRIAGLVKEKSTAGTVE